MLLKSESTTLQKLPYLEVLLSELTDENKINIQENEKLYTLVTELRNKYQNASNQDRVLQTLLLFIK